MFAIKELFLAVQFIDLPSSNRDSLLRLQSTVTIRVEEDGNKMEDIQETKQTLSLR